jgi:hypothetical protein
VGVPLRLPLTDMQRAGSGYGLFVHQRAGVMRVVATR